jgi:hypothetical protein
MALRLRSASTIGSTSAAPEGGIRQDATGERPVQLERNAREREKPVHVPGPTSPTADAAVGLAVTTTRRYRCGWPGGKKC